MKPSSASLSLFSESDRKKAIDSIIAYFLDERNEEIGVIAAGSVLDFIEQEIAPNIYNKALDDAAAASQRVHEEMQFVLSELRK